jgi:hypothetical protein
VRSWLVIAAIGVAAGGAAFALGATPGSAACGVLAGAAIAGATRLYAGDSPAALAAAVIGALLAIALPIDLHADLALPWLAMAAGAWTVAELVRPPRGATVAVALAPAAIAGILEPAFVPLAVIAGIRWARTRRERWAFVLPVICGLVALLAIAAGCARTGTLASLGDRWFGTAPDPDNSLAMHLGDALGPVIATAALGGVAQLGRHRIAGVAIAACVTGAMLVDLRAGHVEPVTLGLAALASALGIARLAGMIRIGSGQVISAATCGLVLLLPPVWTALELTR